MKVIFVVCAMLVGWVRPCSAQVDTLMQDSIFLKEGGVLTGTLIGLVPDQSMKIRTIGGEIRECGMAEIQRVVLFTRRPSSHPRTEAPADTVADHDAPWTGPELRLRVFGGFSFPIGAYAATFGEGAGLAKRGFTFGADGTYAFSSFLAWAITIEYMANPMDLATALRGTPYSGESGDWKAVWLLIGCEVFADYTEQVRLFATAQAGAAIGTFPHLAITYGNARATQDPTSSAAFAYSLSGGMKLSRLMLAFRLVNASLPYILRAEGSVGSFTQSYTQPTTCILLTIGWNIF